MKLIMFTKTLAKDSLEDLVPYAEERGLAGYDLAVRPGQPVSPQNARRELPKAAKLFAESGLEIPLVTAPTSLTDPEDPETEEILAGMADAGIGLIKIGYYRIADRSESYLDQVIAVRRLMEQWERKGREHGVKICYHTHSNAYLGQNAGSLVHLLEGRDPNYVGAFIDTLHLAMEGETFPTAVAMVGPYLAVVALKDVLVERKEQNGHGLLERTMPEAGGGVVNWTQVFNTLKSASFDGPLSVHCEFEVPAEERDQATAREAAFFRRFL